MAEVFDPYRKWLGIPLEERPANHYRLLGLVPFESDADVIENAAARQMEHVRRFTEASQTVWTKAILHELNAARVCLLTPVAKTAYDQQLRAILASRTPMNSPGGQQPGYYPPVAPSIAPGYSQAGYSAPPPLVGGFPDVAFSAGAQLHISGAQRSAIPKRNQSWAPIVVTGVLLTALLGVGLSAYVYRKQIFGEPPPLAQAVPAVVVPAENRVEATSVAADTPAVVEAVEPAVDPQLIRDSFWEARKSLTRRNDKMFQDRMAEAEQWTDKQPPELAVDLQAEADHLKRIAANLAAFWKGLHQALEHDLKPGQTTTYKDDEFFLNGGSEGIITFRFNGKTGLGTIDELPPKVAIVLAAKGLEADKVLRDKSLCTFMLIDSAAIREEAFRAEALKLNEELTAAAGGTADPDLERLLNEPPLRAMQSVTEELLPLAPPKPVGPEPRRTTRIVFASDKVASGVDPLQLVDRNAIRLAKLNLRKTSRVRLDLSLGNAREAASFIKELEAASQKAPNSSVKCANLEVALDLACHNCLARQVATLAETLAEEIGQQGIDVKQQYLAFCQPKSVEEGKTLLDEVFPLMEQAEARRNVALALKYWDLAAKAAEKAQDTDRQMELVEKRKALGGA